MAGRLADARRGVATWFSDSRQLTAWDRISLGGLVLAIVALVVGLVWIWTAAVHPSASGCHNAPLKIIRDPQLVGIAVCIAGLVVGRLTARRVMSSRNELLDRLVPTHERHLHANLAVRVQVGLTGALLFITFLVTFESLTLWRGVWPITYYMRCAAEAATWQTYVAAFFFSALVGRWMWLPMTPKRVD